MGMLTRIRRWILLFTEAARILVSNKLARRNRRIVFASPFGIGDYFFAAGAIEELSKEHIVYVLVTHNIYQNIQALFPTDSTITFIFIDEKILKKSRIQSIARNVAREFRAGVLLYGFELTYFSQILRPDLALDQHYYRTIGANFDKACRGKIYAERILKTLQVDVPKGKYALVHHFPGTNREISTIKSKYDLIFANEFEDKPITSLFNLIHGAAELHLVNSSIYCFAIVTQASNCSQNLYMFRNDILNGMTQTSLTWQEIPLFHDHGTKVNNYQPLNRELHYAGLISKSNGTIRRLFNIAIFGKYPSSWNPPRKEGLS